MKLSKLITFSSTLAFLSLTGACDRAATSDLDIIRGRPLGPDSPALNNVVGLSSDGFSTFCTGSIVADDMVVTAAHCVHKREGFYVVFGQPNGVMEKIAVDKVETYKPYGDAAFPNFDIAWLKLKTKVPARFQPMEILRDPARLNEAKEIRLAGYGYEKTNCLLYTCNDELLETNTALDRYYDSPRLMSLLVFKGDAEKGLGGACNGDSGGPAYARIEDRWYLIGVTNGATIYLTPESYEDPSQSCESGSDIYTFMGDYVPWLQKTSSQELQQKPESNPDRSTPPVLIQGESRAAEVAEPKTWAEWVQYPYHNDEVWNTVNHLLSTLLQNHYRDLQPEELIRIYNDGVFSQALVEQESLLEFSLSTTKAQYFKDQALDLRPLATWTGLKTLLLKEEAALAGIEAASRLPALTSLVLSAPRDGHSGTVSFQALQKLGRSLKTLNLANYTAAELQTLPAAALSQLEGLDLTATAGKDDVTLDLSGLAALKNLRVFNWNYQSPIKLPRPIALDSLEIRSEQATDLKWLDSEAIQSLRSLTIGREALARPDLMKLFQNKGIQDLNVSLNGLTSEHLPPAGFSELTNAVLDGNQFQSAKPLKELPALKTLDLRDNPLTDATCPSGITCTLDRVLNPQTVGDYCRNTVEDRTYVYAPMVTSLLRSQNLPVLFYGDVTCLHLELLLQDARSLMVQGEVSEYIARSALYDTRVLKSLNQLESLTIRHAVLTSSDVLAGLPALKNLDLGFVQTRLDFIKKMPQLVNMNYTDFPRTSLEALSHPGLKVLTLDSEGSFDVMENGRVESIGARTELPALQTLSLRNNPLQDLKGIENLKALTQLDMSGTSVSDLSPLNSLIGTTVFFGESYPLDTCPILYGRCQAGTRNFSGQTFGSDANSVQNSKWFVGQIIPGLGKALRH
ncbi:trypsin-like serine protease [Oligoflexus tunisiensis]|uniref:trypsin-like serine protease n=1 Tax=Oligoflexus tunisiensis TaxID=708132 RepID=UPI00159F233E|nr:trypsin-like serine protease [Oligoflexus tunisiensis]